MNDGDDDRKHPAHWPTRERDNLSVIIFVTVCTEKRKKILAYPESVQVILDAWCAADHWLVGRYVILPDHLHLFCTPARPDALGVQRWIAFWKSYVSKRWPCREQQPISQTDCWDTQLRRNESYSAKWEYVRNNPVRHGLVARAEDWPYQGELNTLEWHDA
ncbi:MAG: transposase [Chthoniobacterales bacterium]